MAAAFEIKIANLGSFLNSLKEYQKEVSDLSRPMSEIARDWMKTNQLFFTLKGPGPWADLSNKGATTKVRGFGSKKTGEIGGRVGGYKAQKLKRWGFVYPILRASGVFERSITVPGDSNNLVELLNGTTLALGSKAVSKTGANYPSFLHHGTATMPSRPWAKISQMSKARWKLILKRYVIDVAGAPGQAPGKQAA